MLPITEVSIHIGKYSGRKMINKQDIIYVRIAALPCNPNNPLTPQTSIKNIFYDFLFRNIAYI